MKPLLTIAVLLLAFAGPVYPQVNIWKACGHHSKVKLTPYPVSGRNNRAVIVCPGGSYYWHASRTEGHMVARWLQKHGVSGFVLDYRVATFPAFVIPYRYIFRGTRYPDAQDDLRQAMRYLKEHAEEYGIDRDRIGAVGFSAGGHLVMSAAELFDKEDRPAFIGSIYPVVTMRTEFTHRRSRRALFGDDRKNDPILKDSLSLERHVPADCPPVFLLNCKDDPIVDYRNSVLLDSALNANRIPHRYIAYDSGGHGFGADPRKGSSQSRGWMEEFLKWLDSLDSLKLQTDQCQTPKTREDGLYRI